MDERAPLLASEDHEPHVGNMVRRAEEGRAGSSEGQREGGGEGGGELPPGPDCSAFMPVLLALVVIAGMLWVAIGEVRRW